VGGNGRERLSHVSVYVFMYKINPVANNEKGGALEYN
jgi:hypothetical protein